jgi:hypothetical protein
MITTTIIVLTFIFVLSSIGPLLIAEDTQDLVRLEQS